MIFRMNSPVGTPNSFTTERLIVRRTEPGDGQLVSEAILESWDLLFKYAPWAKDRENHTPEKEEACSPDFIRRYEERTDFIMSVIEKSSGHFLGRVELYGAEWENRTMNVGYWFRQSAQGKRYASEAVTGLVAFAFDFLNASKLNAVWKSDNAPSGKILTRLGFSQTGLQKGLTDPKTGSQYDEYSCSLTR